MKQLLLLFGITIRLAIIATIVFFIKVDDAVAAKGVGSTIHLALIDTIAFFVRVDDAVAAKSFDFTNQRWN
jgi:hypothetical protein